MTSERWIYPVDTYARNPNGKEIRVYDWIDNRLTIHDFFAKLSLCYGRGVLEYISVTWISNPVGVMIPRTGRISYLKKPVKVAICVLSMTGHRVGDRLESSLTFMELTGIEIGARAADQLIDLIERDEKKRTSVKELRFEAKLVERESTGEDTRNM